MNAAPTETDAEAGTCKLPPCATPVKLAVKLEVATEESMVTVKLALLLPARTVADVGLKLSPAVAFGVILTAPLNPLIRLTLTVTPAVPPANPLTDPTESVNPGTSAIEVLAVCVIPFDTPVKVKAPAPVTEEMV